MRRSKAGRRRGRVFRLLLLGFVLLGAPQVHAGDAEPALGTLQAEAAEAAGCPAEDLAAFLADDPAARPAAAGGSAPVSLTRVLVELGARQEVDPGDFRLLATGAVLREALQPSLVREQRRLPLLPYASVLHPRNLRGWQSHHGGARAQALATFGVPGAFEGRVEIEFARTGDGWRAFAFRLPASGRVVAVVEGRWRLLDAGEAVPDPAGAAVDDPPFARAFRGRGGPRAREPGRVPFDDAAEDGLRWLAAHQSPDGRFGAQDFAEYCDGAPATPAERPEGRGVRTRDVGVTGAALAAFLGAGYTNRGRHPFARCVSRGLTWLKGVQDPEGCFGPRSHPAFLHDHAWAALAMIEAYGMTGSPIFKGSAQRALEFVARARDSDGGWRAVGGDASVTAALLLPLVAAQRVIDDQTARGRPAPLELDPALLAALRAWAWARSTPEALAAPGGEGPPALLSRAAEGSAALLARVLLGENPREAPALAEGAAFLRTRLPRRDAGEAGVDLNAWYFGTLAAFQFGGDLFNEWQGALRRAVLESRRREGTPCGYRGSWDPLGPGAAEGGRVWSTALMTLCCEVHYRYGRVFGDR